MTIAPEKIKKYNFDFGTEPNYQVIVDDFDIVKKEELNELVFPNYQFFFAALLILFCQIRKYSDLFTKRLSRGCLVRT